MPTIKYPKNPNVDTAFVEQEDGTQNRALMVAPQDISTLELPNNPNSTKGYVTIDGNKQRVVLTAQIAGEGGSSLPDQTGHSGEFLTTDGTDASWTAVDALPTQTGNAGKFLTTDGTDASWSDKPLVNSASNPTSSYIIGSVQNLTGLYKVVIGYQAKTSQDDGIAIGHSCNSDGQYATSVGKSIINQGENGVAVGHMAQIDAYSSNTVAIGYSARCSSSGAIAIGQNTRASGAKSIQLGSTGNTTTNSDSNTFKVANGNGNYEIMSADGTIPTDRFTTTPSVDGTYVPTLTISSGTPTRSWAAPSGGLPSQTGNAGKFLTTDGTDASWSDKPLVNKATGSNALCIAGTDSGRGNSMCVGLSASARDEGTAVGNSAKTTGNYAVAVGYFASASGTRAIGIGSSAIASANGAVQIGYGTNSTADTLQYKSYRVIDSDGTIPTDRLTKANTTVTLAVADWSSSTQTVSVTGVTATSIVLVAPDSASQSDYTSAGILCTAQGAGTLTFTCSTTPTNAITVNVVAL